MPTTLGKFGIGDFRFEEMAKTAVRAGGLRNAYVPLVEKDVIEILEMCL